MPLSDRRRAIGIRGLAGLLGACLLVGCGSTASQARFVAENLNFQGGVTFAGWPSHWEGGGKQSAYRLSVDPTTHFRSGASGRIDFVSAALSPGAFGTMTQCDPPGPLAGERVTYSGYLRTADLPPGSWSGLWMRVDGPNKKVLAFDNLGQLPPDRSLKGTTDWTSREIVLDVPSNTVRICFGFLLSGEGTAWADALSFHSVGKAGTGPPVTGQET